MKENQNLLDVSCRENGRINGRLIFLITFPAEVPQKMLWHGK